MVDQGFITEEFTITSSVLSIELSHRLHFFVASPKDIIPRLCSDELHLSLDVYEPLRFGLLVQPPAK